VVWIDFDKGRKLDQEQNGEPFDGYTIPAMGSVLVQGGVLDPRRRLLGKGPLLGTVLDKTDRLVAGS
jgi:hypothetical protein